MDVEVAAKIPGAKGYQILDVDGLREYDDFRVGQFPRSTRRLMKPTHRPEDTPFLEKLDDVRSVYQALRDGNPERDVPGHEQTAVAFAVGAFGGLRTGEVLGLRWDRVDLDARRIRVVEQVQESALGPLKDDEARTVPIQDALLPSSPRGSSRPAARASSSSPTAPDAAPAGARGRPRRSCSLGPCTFGSARPSGSASSPRT